MPAEGTLVPELAVTLALALTLALDPTAPAFKTPEAVTDAVDVGERSDRACADTVVAGTVVWEAAASEIVEDVVEVEDGADVEKVEDACTNFLTEDVRVVDVEELELLELYFAQKSWALECRVCAYLAVLVTNELVDVADAGCKPPSVLPLLVAEEVDAIDKASLVVAADVADVASEVDAELDATEVETDEVDTAVLDVEASDVALRSESALDEEVGIPEEAMQARIEQAPVATDMCSAFSPNAHTALPSLYLLQPQPRLSSARTVIVMAVLYPIAPGAQVQRWDP